IKAVAARAQTPSEVTCCARSAHIRSRQTKPSPRRPFPRILSSSCQESRACALTVKLNGRPEAQWARQSDSTLKAHQAPSHAEFHGPFQRLLERTHRAYCARAAFSRETKDDAVTK